MMASPSNAEEQAKIDFVINNVLGTLYHELGHAFIDVFELPVLGQEEDAADVLSSVLIEEFYQEEATSMLAQDIALGFQISAQEFANNGEQPAFWDVHGPDEQRAFNQICLHYGADPENRKAFADLMNLPDDRRESCPFEYEKASQSWLGMLDTYLPESEDKSEWISYTPFGAGQSDLIQAVDLSLVEEAEFLRNYGTADISIDLKLESCGEENAFYDPSDRSITICTEIVELYYQQAGSLN